MGDCVSLSRSPPASTAAAELGQQVVAATATAKVVDLDGSMAQFTGPVRAREALAGDERHRRAPPPCFICSSDELCFDAPVRALAAEEALQPGQLYFVLPTPKLRRPLSGQDMAALAVKASTALAVAAGLATTAPGAPAASRRRKKGDAGKRRQTARVAPLLVADGSWSHHAYDAPGAHETGHVDGDDRTVGKTSRRRSGDRRRRAGVQTLSAIAEDSE